MRPDVEATVNRILVEEFELEPARVTAEAHLVDDLELDSLDAVDLIAALEDAFGGRVDEEEARKVRTVSDVYALIGSAIERAVQTGRAPAPRASEALEAGE
ncbi:MAG: acyl carrier protein [Myxococcales bacterium]|nr:acyl carrier protein [Myxococcales bacterium]MCB9651744.1 acyl carrier protein [Deltaproteobacteria bacterium]